MTALNNVVTLAVEIAHDIWASSIDIFGLVEGATSGRCSVMMGRVEEAPNGAQMFMCK